MTTTAKTYTIVSFGSVGSTPVRGSYRSLASAQRTMRAIREAGDHAGTVRLYECDTPALARTADVSEVRDGERIVEQI